MSPSNPPPGPLASHGVAGITESDIANYLVNTPAFFERHAELLSTVTLKSPHGQRAVSLQERQMEMLREKIKGLEHKLMEMLRHGQENVLLADKVHRYTRALMLTHNPGELPAVAVNELMHQFLIPQAAVRVWDADTAYALEPFARDVGEDVKTFATSLPQPYCGVNSGFDAAKWVEDPSAVSSLALVPLRSLTRDGASAGAPAFGLLVLASPDPTRYSHDMGTEFLTRIGEIASAALSRLLPQTATA